eukprot:GHVT01070133.1.p1 GENE.GHVT01070133.1~~GHVT01070133.1.p1  ORF type:complete len:262 (-),score=61.53 GHVT01070133.1:244-1029(-)
MAKVYVHIMSLFGCTCACGDRRRHKTGGPSFLPELRDATLPDLRPSTSFIESFLQTDQEEFKRAAPNAQWPPVGFSSSIFLYGRAFVLHRSSGCKIEAFVAVPLDESPSRFRLVQQSPCLRPVAVSELLPVDAAMISASPSSGVSSSSSSSPSSCSSVVVPFACPSDSLGPSSVPLVPSRILPASHAIAENGTLLHFASPRLTAVSCSLSRDDGAEKETPGAAWYCRLALRMEELLHRIDAYVADETAGPHNLTAKDTSSR